VQALRASGLQVLGTREPGGAPGAEAIRDLLLRGDAAFTPITEVLLHFAARAEHVARTIRPALDAGSWVVCDRFADSTMAYQGYGLGADRDKIARLTEMIGLRPDLTLVLTVAPEAASARLAQRGLPADRYERLRGDFHARVAAGFRAIAAAEPGRCVLIDANGDADAVHRRVMEAVRERLLCRGLG
jgi:dTMP kinase